MIPKNFKEHELWELLEKIDKTIQNLPPISYQSEEDRHTIISRLPLYVSAVKQHKFNAAGFYSNNLLNNMNTQWKNISSILDSLSNNPARAHEIDSYLDRMAEDLAKWPATFTLRESAASKAVSIFEEAQSTLLQRIEHLEQLITAKEEELTERESHYQELRKETDTNINELHKRLDENKQLIKTQNEKITTQEFKHSELFEAAQDERRKTYETWLNVHQERVDKKSDHIISALDEKLADGDQHLQNIKKLHEEVEQASHGAAAAYLARDYNAASKRDYTAGLLFMGLGIILLIVAGIVLYGSFVNVTPGTSITWQWTALKVSATLLITAGATFTFKFSQNFLASASRFKQTELELRAIKPFLADIGQKELADQTKIDFINRSFGQFGSVNASKSKEATSTDKNNETKISYKEMLETVITTLKNTNG